MLAPALLLAAAHAAQAPAPAPLTAAPLTVATARQSLVGQWHGELEYRDYQADRCFD